MDSLTLLFGAPLVALSENDIEIGIWQNQLARHCPDISFLGFSRVAVHVCLTRLDCVVLDLCVKSATLCRELQSCWT